MSSERRYPDEVLRSCLDRQLLDIRVDEATNWLAKVIELLRDDVPAISPPVRRVESIPEYIYPH